MKRIAVLAHELIGREAIAEHGSDADLLQGDDVKRKLRAPSNDARAYVLETEADFEGAQAQRRGRGRA